jgi:aryl-alcohol dehydrogenase-like predicted oxidoreductase
MMEYVQLGRTGVRVSPLCLGTVNFGMVTDEADAVRIIHKALDAGINFIDTADVYNDGRSEEIVGKALKESGARDSVVLATKVNGSTGPGPNDRGNNRRHVMQGVETSLKRLGTDWIDLYQFHTPDPSTPIDESLRAMDDLIRQGKLRYCGTSNFTGWQLVEALWTAERQGLHSFASEQPHYNIFRRNVEREVLPVAQKYGIAVIPYSPIAGGWLGGKYRKSETTPVEKTRRGMRNDQLDTPAGTHRLDIIESLADLADGKGATLSQFALAWVGSNPAVTAPIIGPRTEAHLDDNLAALDVVLTEEDMQAVDELVAPGVDLP